MLEQKKISVCFTADQFDKYADGKSTVVVVDLLRATTVISTAFKEGVVAIIPVQTLDEALSYKDKEGYIVAAERNAKPIEGFDYGNSPFHYINADVKGKTLVLTTTNGTKAIHNAREHKVITSSYINIEAGLGWIKKFTKEFINHEELKVQKEEGATRKLIGLEIIDKGIARKDYPIVDADGNEIGIVTSGTMSPSLNKAIAMAYVSKDLSEIGCEVYIQVRKKLIKAVVVALPFLK